MKRIMFVCQSLGNGGAERVVSVLSEALDKTQYKIYILAMTSAESAYSISPNVCAILPDKEIKNGITGKFQRIASIRHQIIDKKIDIVIAFSHYNVMFSVLAAVGLKVKVIGSERNDPAQIKDRRFINGLRNVLYRRLDYLVCQTNDAKAYFPKKIQSKSAIILNPISDGLPDAFNEKREKRIVTFCRLDKQKNLPMLIDAFEKLHAVHPEFTLDIYGNGNEKESLQNYVKSKELENVVNLLPFCRDIHMQVRKATAFALSSNYEGLSNSMIEAMSIGLPTIVTDCPCGGARMVIKNEENGILVPVGDSDGMFRALLSVIENEEFAKRLSEEGTKIRIKLDKSKIAEQWAAILDKC